YRDPEMDRIIRRHWSSAGSKLSSAEKLAELSRIKGALLKPGESQKGRAHYAQLCAACHTLFDEGGQLGPDLTGYDRSNLDFWLLSILDPSIEIREGYHAYTVRLKGGQTLMGLLARQDAT